MVDLETLEKRLLDLEKKSVFFMEKTDEINKRLIKALTIISVSAFITIICVVAYITP